MGLISKTIDSTQVAFDDFAPHTLTRGIIALEKIRGAWCAMRHDEHRMSLREVVDLSNDILF